MAQQVKTLAALPEDSTLVVNIGQAAHNHLQLPQGNTTSLASVGIHSHSCTQIYTQNMHTYTQIKK